MNTRSMKTIVDNNLAVILLLSFHNLQNFDYTH